MIWIAAEWIVASMENKQPLFDLALHYSIGDPVN